MGVKQNKRSDQEKSKNASERPIDRIVHEIIEDIRGRAATSTLISGDRMEPMAGSAPSQASAEPDLSRDQTTATDGTHQPIEDLREKIKSIGHHLTDCETGRTREKADAMPRAAGMMLMPFGLIVRQQARVWNLMLDALEMQRQFVEIWRPPHR